MTCHLNGLPHSPLGSEALQEVGQVGAPTAGQGDEEGASEYTRGNHGVYMA
jgi:hypothetical protein